MNEIITSIYCFLFKHFTLRLFYRIRVKFTK